MRYGFTLVELSMVLVIIGLLIGGILVAQSMVQTAKIESEIKQIEQIQIAMTNFKTTYNCLPGDCTAFETPGNGDGKIGALVNYPNLPDGNENWAAGQSYNNIRSEWQSVFDHLAHAQMYELAPYDDLDIASLTAGIGYPKMIIQDRTVSSAGVNGGIIIGWEEGNNYIKEGHKLHLGACPEYPHGSMGTANSGFNCGLLPATALAIDSKLDDGKPFSGDLVNTASYYIYRTPGGLIEDETGGCGVAATNSYSNTKTANCSLEILLNLN